MDEQFKEKISKIYKTIFIERIRDLFNDFSDVNRRCASSKDSEYGFNNPDSKIVKAVMFVYSMESKFYSGLNKACREFDQKSQEE